MEAVGRDYFLLGGRPRRGGAAAVTSDAKHGLSLSTETLSWRPPTWMVKYFGPLVRTLYGPSYSGDSGIPGAPLLTNTNWQNANSLGGLSVGTWPAKGRVGRLVGGRRRLSMKEAAGGSTWSSSSPGSDNGTPYSNSAAETLKSSLGAARRPSSTQGRCAGQSLVASLARMESFSWR